MCEYGCGHIAKYELANGKKCCSKSTNSCEANKAKNASSKIDDKVCPYCHTEFKQINGVSRDHMFSVKDGFINYIDPIFLAHPANCRLIRHNENISKLDKSLFSKTELLSRIIEWDNKYGKYNVNMNYNNFDLIYDWKK